MRPTSESPREDAMAFERVDLVGLALMAVSVLAMFVMGVLS